MTPKYQEMLNSSEQTENLLNKALLLFFLIKFAKYYRRSILQNNSVEQPLLLFDNRNNSIR